MCSNSKERLRFSMSDDLCLLREVLSINPYEDAQRWKFVMNAVVQGTHKQFTMRAIKEHLQHILMLWVKEDRANIRKSGTEVEYNEKEVLLQQVTDLAREFRRKSKKTMKSEFVDYNMQHGAEIRNEATFQIESDVETPTTPSVSGPAKSVTGPYHNRLTRKSSLKNAGLMFLREKQTDDKELKEKQMELDNRKIVCEERKLHLDEKKAEFELVKFELEKKEREMRLQMELEERRQHNENEKQQQQIINVLLKMQK